MQISYGNVFYTEELHLSEALRREDVLGDLSFLFSSVWSHSKCFCLEFDRKKPLPPGRFPIRYVP